MPNLVLLDLLSRPAAKSAAASEAPVRMTTAAVGHVVKIAPGAALRRWRSDESWEQFLRDPTPVLKDLLLELTGSTDGCLGMIDTLRRIRDVLQSTGALPPVVGLIEQTRHKGRSTRPAEDVPLWPPTLAADEDALRTRAVAFAVALVAVACQGTPLIRWSREPDPRHWHPERATYLRLLEGARVRGAGASHA